MLEIEAVEVGGRRPVHKVGDRIVIDGPRIALDKTDALCIHALSVLLHYAAALDEGASPVRLGLTKPTDEEHAYVQCVDPWKPYTNGGTVVFRIKRRVR